MKTCRYIKFCSLYIVLLLNSVASVAQGNQFITIPRPDNANGIWITDIKQDQLGYLWVANPGIARYDGDEWKTYLHNPQNTNSLASNEVEVICPTSDGLVWVGTKGYGLDCLDPVSGKFSHYFVGGNEDYNEKDNFIAVLLETTDGVLWIGTHNGLYSRDPADGQFTHYQARPGDSQGLSHHQVRVILEDREGTIWIGTGDPSSNLGPDEGGLNRLDRKTGEFTQYKAKPDDPYSLFDNRVRAIFEDSEGTLWIGTYGDGLHTLDRQTGQFTRYPYNPVHLERLSRPYPKTGKFDSTFGITFIKEDLGGHIWVGAYEGGLVRYNAQTKQILRFNRGPKGGLPTDFLWAASSTRDGTMFFGSSRGHLVKFEEVPSPIPFQHTTEAVQALYEDPEGAIWLGSFGNGGLFIQKRDKHQSKLNTKQLQLELQNTRIISIIEDKDKQVWLSTWGKGLYCYNLNTQTIQNYEHDPNDSNSLSPGRLGWLVQDQAGTIWLATEGGLDQLNQNNKTFTHYRHEPADSNSISATHCTGILVDFSGKLWIGTMGGGLNLLNHQTGIFKHYLEDETIFQIYEDSDQSLWVVSQNGLLYRYQRSKDQFIPLDEPTFIKPINRVKSVIEDDKHNLWLGTRIGIVRLDSSRTVATFFDENYGFYDPESIYYASCLKTREGKLYFGGVDGYYHFYPDQLKAIQSKVPNLILSSLTFAGRAVDELSEPMFQTNRINLTYKQSTFSLGFKALVFSFPEQIQYAYKLDNYDLEWHIGKERIANYYKVPPGEYVFRVKTTKPGSDWIERSLGVIISPPWWRTWWAYIIYALAFLLTIIGVDRYQRRRLLQKQEALAKEKELRHAREIEKAYTELEAAHEHLKTTQEQLVHSEKMASLGELTAGIAHEIQNPLNFVNNFSELNEELLEELVDELANVESTDAKEIVMNLLQNEEKIKHHGKRAESIVKSMLQHSQSSAESKERTDINALVDEYLRLAYHGFRAKDKRFQATFGTDLEPHLPNVEVRAQDIGRVLLNLINNAFHAVSSKALATEDGDYKPKVRVKTELAPLEGGMGGDKLILTISDNGPGIPENIKDKIFQPFFTTKPTGKGTGLGLSLSYDIVKAHGGEIKVESEVGEGTEFIIQIPIE